MKKTLALALLSVALAALKVDAQDAPAINASLQTLGLGVSYDDLYLQQSGGRHVRLPVRTDFMSDTKINYTGPLSAPILRRVGSGKDASYVPVGSVRFPAPASGLPAEVILIFPPGGSVLAPALVRNDRTSFPGDSVRVINTLARPAAILVQKTAQMMQPGEVRIFPSSASDRLVEVHVALPRKNRWTEVCNNVFPLAAEYRRTIFIIDCTPAQASAARRPVITLLTLAQSEAQKTAMAADAHGDL